MDLPLPITRGQAHSPYIGLIATPSQHTEQPQHGHEVSFGVTKCWGPSQRPRGHPIVHVPNAPEWLTLNDEFHVMCISPN